jgi:hypothetical protein
VGGGSLVVAAGLALALAPAGASAEEAADAPAAATTWSVTTNLGFLILPVFNGAAEYRLGDSSSASVHAGIGRVTIDLPFGDDSTNTVFHVGGAYHHYLLGGFRHGLALGGDVRYVNAGSGKLLNVENAVAIGPFVGYKKIFDLGFTIDLRLGAQIAFGEADALISPLLHAGVGWSF